MTFLTFGNGLKLADMRGLSYDDPQLDALLDQMTIQEMGEVIAMGAIPSNICRFVIEKRVPM